MNDKSGDLIKCIVYLILGIFIGISAEFALIYDNNIIIKITQSYVFYLLLSILICFFQKNYINMIINSFVCIEAMNISYYLTRLIFLKHNINLFDMKFFSLLAIALCLMCSSFIYIIKYKINEVLNKKEKNKKNNVIAFTYISFVSMIVFFIVGIIVNKITRI